VPRLEDNVQVPASVECGVRGKSGRRILVGAEDVLLILEKVKRGLVKNEKHEGPYGLARKVACYARGSTWQSSQMSEQIEAGTRPGTRQRQFTTLAQELAATKGY
jgi:hypothetical protein